MAKNTKQGLVNLKERFEAVANDYLNAFLEQFELDAHYGFWVGDEVGGLYINGNLYYVDFEEMRYIVDNNVSEKTYIEWFDYCDKCLAFDKPHPSLEAWCKGCPKISDEEWKRLELEVHKTDNA